MCRIAENLFHYKVYGMYIHFKEDKLQNIGYKNHPIYVAVPGNFVV